MEHSHQPCSLLLFSSNQFRNECEGVRSQPVFLKDFGVYEKNRSTSAKHWRVEYDYHDIVYPIPFNTLYNNISTHYIDYGKAPEGLPLFVLTGDIPEFDKQFSDVLMMTGASDNHAYGSFNALYSMVLADPYASYLYIDLGISDVFKEKLLGLG